MKNLKIGFIILLWLGLVSIISAGKIVTEKIDYTDPSYDGMYSILFFGTECYSGKPAHADPYYASMVFEMGDGDKNAETVGTNKLITMSNLLKYLEETDSELKYELEKRVFGLIPSHYTENLIFTKKAYERLLKEENTNIYFLITETTDRLKVFAFNFDSNRIDKSDSGNKPLGQCELVKFAMTNTDLLKDLDIKIFKE